MYQFLKIIVRVNFILFVTIAYRISFGNNALRYNVSVSLSVSVSVLQFSTIHLKITFSSSILFYL